MFQSTHPRRVRRDLASFILSLCRFQSTHPRRVRLLPEVFSNKLDKVSIHAPAKGATPLEYLQSMFSVFQSTHPRRVRPGVPFVLTPSIRFQSTHPRRVRLECLIKLFFREKVSIHAPAKGATST